MAKRRRPGKNQPTEMKAIDSLMPARLPSEPSPSGPKAGLSATTDALESAAASLARAASKPESFFQANEGVAKVSCSILVYSILIWHTPLPKLAKSKLQYTPMVHTSGMLLYPPTAVKMR